MHKEIVSTDNAPKAIGPYSQAIRFDRQVFVSGQIPMDPKSGEVVSGDIKKQTRQVIENLRGVLEASGSSLQNVLRTTIFLTNINDYTMVNETYTQYFGSFPPARSTVQVSGLPKNVHIEIDAIAYTTPHE